MLPHRGVAMKCAHNFQFGGDGLPRESAVSDEPQRIRFNLHTLHNDTGDVVRQRELLEPFAKRLRQCGENLLLLADAFSAAIRELK